MEVRYFKLVVAIAETGSVTRAADKLFLTQSALSHQLKEIEQQLDFRLFHRVNKKLSLTQKGRIFLDHAKTILGEIQKLKTDIDRTSGSQAGLIRLTTESSTCYHWFPRILKTYQAEFPNVEVRLNTRLPNQPLRLLLSGKVDMAIVHRVKPDKNLKFHEVLTDEVVALVPQSDPLAKKNYLSPKDFSRLHYVTHSKRLNESAFYEGFLKPHEVMPAKVTYLPLTEAVVGMVKEGLGVAVMSSWLIDPYLDPAKMKPVSITRNGFRRRWFIATLKNSEPAEHLDRFAEHVKAVMIGNKRTAGSHSTRRHYSTG